MIDIKDVGKAQVSQFRYNDKIYEIPITAVVKIDNTLFGRFDILISRFYNGQMELLSLLLDFNKITDPTEVQIGMIVEIPDYQALIDILELTNAVDTDIVPGIIKSANNRLVNQENTKTGKKSTKTTASPRLKITLPEVSYNEKTGMLTL